MISLSNITKYFHKGSINEVLALEDVSLNVRTGDFITVIGSNGAGKSTLLNCLAGSYPVDDGSIFIDGEDVTSWPEHRRAGNISRVFQNPLLGTCASLTIEQNLALVRIVICSDVDVGFPKAVEGWSFRISREASPSL